MTTLTGYWFGLAHGFNVRDRGAGTTDQLRPHLERRGARVVEFDREHEGLIAAMRGDDEAAHQLGQAAAAQSVARERVALVGHSHGCNIIHKALQVPAYVECVGHAVLINPALRVDAEFPPDVRVTCYYSWHDLTVSSSRLLRLLPWRWIWRHPWGEAGRKGLRRTGANVVNIDLERLCGRRIEHSTVFHHEAALRNLAGSIAQRVG